MCRWKSRSSCTGYGFGMALTPEFKGTVGARARRDAKFRDAIKRLTWEENVPRDGAREGGLERSRRDAGGRDRAQGKLGTRANQVCVPARRSSRQPLVRQLPSGWRCMG